MLCMYENMMVIMDWEKARWLETGSLFSSNYGQQSHRNGCEEMDFIIVESGV